MDETGAGLPAEGNAVVRTADIDIFDIGARGEMLDVRGAVEHRADIKLLELSERLILGHIAVISFHAFVEFLDSFFTKVVEHHILQALLR